MNNRYVSRVFVHCMSFYIRNRLTQGGVRLMNRVARRFILLPAVFAGALFAADVDLDIKPIFDKASYAPGDTVHLALRVSIPRTYHLYGNPLGPGIGKPLVLDPNSESVRWVGARKSPAKKFQPDMGDWVWAYEKQATFFITGILDQAAKKPATGAVKLDGLICHTACVPISKSVDFQIPLGEGANAAPFEEHRALVNLFAEAESMEFGATNGKKAQSGQSLDLGLNLGGLDAGGDATEEAAPRGGFAEAAIDWDYDPVENRTELNFLLAIVFAFVAGLILNVMPCVLPVLGIKVLSFSQGQGSSRKEAVLRSLVFAAGMIIIFLALASFAAFAGLSWGEQFQKPSMLVAIIGLVFFFALSLFDVYTIMVPAGIGALQQKQAQTRGYAADLFKGMFTTVLATPCSGPLLGATLAWTLRQPPATIYAVFAAIGVGMAFPYVVLSSSKRLSRLIPKPGGWMDDFKHFMGFLLIGFAVYLMIGLPKDMLLSTVALCLAIAVAAFVYGRYAKFGSSWTRKLTSGIAAVIVIFAGWYVSFEIIYPSISEQAAQDMNAEAKSVTWQPFSPTELGRAHARGRHVLVNFTANWCMNCQYNKIRVLGSNQVKELIKRKDVIPMKADLTQENAVAESLLRHLGSRSIPFLAIFPGDDPYNPIIMRDLLSKKRLARQLSALAEN